MRWPSVYAGLRGYRPLVRGVAAERAVTGGFNAAGVLSPGRMVSDCRLVGSQPLHYPKGEDVARSKNGTYGRFLKAASTMASVFILFAVGK